MAAFSVLGVAKDEPDKVEEVNSADVLDGDWETTTFEDVVTKVLESIMDSSVTFISPDTAGAKTEL